MQTALGEGSSGMARDRLRWLTARPIAHRGLHRLDLGRPENTLAAFSAAIAEHFAIECDIHLSADGVPVVFHDAELERLTGHRGRVDRLSAAELGDLRILRTAEWIPTLEETLALVAGRVPIVIEMKETPGREARLAAATAALLDAYPGAAALMSFDRGLLAAARAAQVSVPLGLTAEGDWRSALRHWRTLGALKLDFISYAIDDLPTPLPVLARTLLGIPLICWTVRTAQQREKARRWTDQITFEAAGAPA